MQGQVVASLPHGATATPLPPLICFSHLRWDFVTQRPQHLMKRFAAERRVFFWEEHIPCDHPLAFLEYHPFPEDGVIALRPRVPHWWDKPAVEAALRKLLDMLVATSVPAPPVLWFYTPMMLGFADHLCAETVVYDCMDELAAFAFADPLLVEREAALIRRAEVMFTGGHSLYEAKRDRHDAIHPFPSAVDVGHFAAARGTVAEPADQAGIAGPKLGFYGVIDERIDLALIDAVAAARPDWQIVMIGPVAKIDPAALPRRANIHWLGARRYEALPAYLAGWSVALMPFAINAATRFISPTKTPEYLAAGRPVVSTPIVDVMRHYGAIAGVRIAADAAAFVAGCEAALALPPAGAWRDEADRLLAATSWDRSFEAMKQAMAAAGAPAMPAPAIHPAGRRPHYDALVVGAGFAGSVLAERLAQGSGKRVLVIDKRPHIAGNAFDQPTPRGFWSTATARTSSTPTATRSSTTCRASPHGGPTSTGCWRRCAASWCRCRSTAPRSTALWPRAHRRGAGGGVPRRTGRGAGDPHRGGRRRRRGRARALRDLLPRLHPQAMGARPVRAGPRRDRAGADAHRHRRPLLPRQAPGDAGAGLHRDVRGHARPSQHHRRDSASTSPTATCAPRTPSTPGRSTRISTTASARCPTAASSSATRRMTWRSSSRSRVVNYPAPDVPHTRITEYKHLTGQRTPRTSISYEIPRAEGDPYYPIPRAENQALYRRYEALADALPDVSFVGRLATYRYYNMDQVVGQALATYRRLASRFEEAIAAA